LGSFQKLAHKLSLLLMGIFALPSSLVPWLLFSKGSGYAFFVDGTILCTLEDSIK
jgi:hypothetical protein